MYICVYIYVCVCECIYMAFHCGSVVLPLYFPIKCVELGDHYVHTCLCYFQIYLFTFTYIFE